MRERLFPACLRVVRNPAGFAAPGKADEALLHRQVLGIKPPQRPRARSDWDEAKAKRQMRRT